MSEENQNIAPCKQEPPRDRGGCFMCQIHDALLQDNPEVIPPPIRTVKEAENYLSTMLYCGMPILLAIRYRRTRVMRKYFILMLTILLLSLAAVTAVIVVLVQRPTSAPVIYIPSVNEVTTPQ